MVDMFCLSLTLYTLTSVCIFSILLAIHFTKVLTRRICLAIVATPYSKYSLFSHGVAMVSCRKLV